MVSIVSGTVVERCQFWVNLILPIVISSTILLKNPKPCSLFLKYLDTIFLGWIYPVAQYWSWSGISFHSGAQGWLKSLGFLDFAGSGVVHLLGGTCGLVGCIMTGPRSNTSGEQGHSKPLVALGGAILLLGFMAFNSGSSVSKNRINSGI